MKDANKKKAAENNVVGNDMNKLRWSEVVKGGRVQGRQRHGEQKEEKNSECDARTMMEDVGGEIMVIGDSLVRYLDKTCAKDKANRLRVCFAGVGDVSERLSRTVRGSDRNATVIVHVGSNDVVKQRSEELMKKYEILIRTLKESGRRGVVSAILPRVGVSSDWLSRAIGINTRVEGLCRENGMHFIDNWEVFYGRRDLFQRDGVHLNICGVECLA